MVEIIYEPWKTIVIHEIVQYDLQASIQLQSLGVQSGQTGRPVYWVNGVAFVHRPMPSTEEVIKENMQGKIHWSSLIFAFMPKYQQLFTIPDGNIKIPILNLSDNGIFKDVADWIKKNYISR